MPSTPTAELIHVPYLLVLQKHALEYIEEMAKSADALYKVGRLEDARRIKTAIMRVSARAKALGIKQERALRSKPAFVSV